MERLEDLAPYLWIGDSLDKLQPRDAPGQPGAHVTHCVPREFAAYCKVLHPIYERPNAGDTDPSQGRANGQELFPNLMDEFARRIPKGGRRVLWAELARRLGLVFHPEINERSLGRNFPDTWEGWHRHFVGPEEGTLDESTCSRLVEMLKPFVCEQICYFQYDLIATRALYREPPGSLHDYGLLYKGALEEVLAISRLDAVRGTPSHWWAEDRGWCLNTSWDLNFTLLGGPERLVAALLSDTVLECLPVGPSSRIDSRADRINP